MLFQSLQVAALKNDSRAMYVLGVIYMNGMGLPKMRRKRGNGTVKLRMLAIGMPCMSS